MSIESDGGSDYNSVWATCPPDILFIIFKKLDIKSLINCMDVNKYWRSFTDYYCEHAKLWEAVVKHGISNQGFTFTEKSILGWQDQFLCAQRWHYIKNVTVCLQHKYKYDFIRNICVHRDNLIVVSNDDVKYYNIETGELVKTIETSYLRYEETTSVTVDQSPQWDLAVGFNVLFLTNKLCKERDSDEAIKIILHNIPLYKVHMDACYVVDIKNVLWIYRATESYWDCKVLAKYYGNKNSMCSIHIYMNKVYVLLKKGDVLLVDEGRKKFVKILRFDLPTYSLDFEPLMFHYCNVFWTGPSGNNNEKLIEVYQYKGEEIIAFYCFGVSSTLEHGDAFLLGFDDGRIEIYLIKNLLKKSTVPELELNLQSYVNESLSCPKITSIDVYEDNTAHHLYVTTEEDVYELMLSY